MSDVPAKYNPKERPEMDPQWSKPPFSVALVGGGITGVTLAIALLKRGIDVKIYEQARAFTEIGAGIAFSPNAKQAMGKCDPAICEAYERIATRSGSEKKKYTWYDWVDGYNQPDGAPPTPLFTIERDSTADGCHRAHLLKELLKLVPEGVAEFNKRLESIDEPDINGPLTLKFFDGTDRAADLVIGCDGIKSHVRRLLVGSDSPQASPSYTHKYAYRGLIPMPKAIEVLGEDMANTRTMYLGQNGHIITFPVAHGQIMNVVAFHHDFQNWEDEQLVVPTTRTEAQRDFADWGQNAKAIIELLQDTLDKWGIFDLGDEPMSFYSKGRVCVAGDAAHATGPHHGAGAGFCIEDSAVLAELLHVAWASLQGGLTTIPKNGVLGHVLSVYDNARRERTQWLVRSSRISADLYDWMDQDCGRDPLKIKNELLWRNQRIWNVSIDDMTQDANKTLEAAICDAHDLHSIVNNETTATY